MDHAPVYRRRALCALGAAALCAPLHAQPRFPERPITLLVPFGPGGIADLTARAVAEVMATSLGQPVAAGVVKALAVSSDRRNPALPEVPTVQQAGVAGYNVASWNAIAAPAGTPPEVVTQVNRAVREAVAAPAVQEKMARLGMRLQSSTPAELQGLLGSEIQRWGEVIRAAKIEPE